MKKIIHWLKGLRYKLQGKDYPLFYTRDIFASKNFTIGVFTYGEPLVLFENPKSNLTIGKYCSISKNVTVFLGGNHRKDWVTTYPFNALSKTFPEATSIEGHPSTNGDVHIGNDVWIGRSVTILSGVEIGDGAIIGTNSLVTKNVGPYEIWGGNPARKIGDRFDDKTKKELLEIKWWEMDETIIRENVELLCADPAEFIKKFHQKS